MTAVAHDPNKYRYAGDVCFLLLKQPRQNLLSYRNAFFQDSLNALMIPEANGDSYDAVRAKTPSWRIRPYWC